jgi:hypothetical protein
MDLNGYFGYSKDLPKFKIKKPCLFLGKGV